MYKRIQSELTTDKVIAACNVLQQPERSRYNPQNPNIYLPEKPRGCNQDIPWYTAHKIHISMYLVNTADAPRISPGDRKTPVRCAAVDAARAKEKW